MKELFVLIAHPLTTLITLARPGSVRAVAAESMALKLQLVVVHRTRKRAPPMTPWDRLVFGLCALWIAPSRRQRFRLCSVLPPSSAFTTHWSGASIGYCSVRKGGESPAPKDLRRSWIEAAEAMKRQNPRFGCLKIAQEITHAFWVEVNKDVIRRILERVMIKSCG